MNALQIDNITHRFGVHTLMENFSLTVESGKFVCVLGPSGSGKTTLLRLIAGLDPLQHGHIMLGGSTISQPHYHVPTHLRHVGMVFQQPTLFPHLTVGANVMFGMQHMSEHLRATKMREWLTQVNLSEKENQFPHQLSGGEQHRIALVRALAAEVKLLLLDEPFSNLDRVLRQSIRQDTYNLCKARGITCLLVTHDVEEAMALADTLVVLDEQFRIRQQGTPKEICSAPADEFVKAAVGLECRV